MEATPAPAVGFVALAPRVQAHTTTFPAEITVTGNIAWGATLECWVTGGAVNNNTWTGNIGQPANQPAAGVCF